MSGQPIVIDERLDFTGSLRALQLQPGDVLVLESERLLSADAALQIGRLIRDVWPGHKCIVLENGLKLGVVRSSHVPSLSETEPLFQSPSVTGKEA